VTWQPEELPTPPPNITPTLNSSLCLTKDTLSQLAPHPTQMIGKILMYEQMENGEEWGITLSDLDGNQRQVIADSGSWAAISTDGNRVVYSMQDGLAIVDLLSGQVKSLGIDGYNPRWSPDGRQIAFISGEVPDVFVISADGTNLERVTNEANGTNAVAGWSSDGMRLYITRLGVDGHILRAVDMPNRSITDLFMLANSSIKAPFATISPDGEWVAYRDTHLSSLYLARMDGSEFRLLIQNPGSGISGAVWSGDWLAVTLRMVDHNEHILLRPDTCQAFLLNLSEGEIQGLLLP
jgi:Tol biopolymer transport system component